MVLLTQVRASLGHDIFTALRMTDCAYQAYHLGSNVTCDSVKCGRVATPRISNDLHGSEELRLSGNLEFGNQLLREFEFLCVESRQ